MTAPFDPQSLDNYVNGLFKPTQTQRPSTTPAPYASGVVLPLPRTSAQMDADTMAGFEADEIDADPTQPPRYKPVVYGPGTKQPQKPFIERANDTFHRVAEGAGDFVKQFATDLNVVEKDITPRERLFRAANVGSFFLPPVALGRTAGLAARVAMRGAEAGAITGALTKLRGDDQPVVPNAALGAGIGGTIEALLSRGRVRTRGRLAAELAEKFAKDLPTALHSEPWAVVGGQLSDSGHLRLTPEQNAARHEALRREIETLGYQPMDASGIAPKQELDQFEKVMLVPGMDRREAMELAKRYGQRSMLTSDGFFDLDAQTVSPLKKLATRFNESILPDDYRTHVGDHKFAMDFDEPIEYGGTTKEDLTDATAHDKLESLISRDEPTAMDKLINYPLKSTLKSWYIKTVRSFAGIEDMERMLGERSADRAPQDSAAKLAQLAAGWSTYAEHAWEFGLPKWKDRTVNAAPGLSSLFERVNPGEWDAFERYGFARRFKHLSDARDFTLPGGLTPADVETIITDTERTAPHLKSVLDDVQAWRNTALHEMLVEPGILSKQAFEAITSESKEYVPLRRAFDHASEQLRQTMPLDAAILHNPVDRIGALRGKFAPWTESLVRDVYSWSKLAHNQDYMLQMIREFEKNDPSAVRLFAERVNAPTPELSDIQKTVIAQLSESDPEMARAAEATGTELLGMLAPSRMLAKGFIGGLVPHEGFASAAGEFMPKQQMDKALMSRQMTGQQFLDEGWHESNEVKRVWYKVTNPDIWEAVQTMNAPQMNLATKLMGAVGTILRSGATLSFEFMARNPIKDVFHAGVTNGLEPNSIVDGFSQVLNKGDMYKKYLASGGGRASLISMDREAISKQIQNAVGFQESSGGLSKLYNVVKSPIEALQALSDFLESGTRVGAYGQKYRELVNAGTVPAEAARTAALAARNATVDFGIHGSRTQTLRLITAFWNAQIQGYDNMVRSFAADPAKATARALTYVTLPSVALYLANRDDPEYFELPQWEREMFWHVKMPESTPWVGDKWLRVPKPFDIGVVFGSSVESFLQFLDAHDKQAVDALAGAYVSKTLGDLMPIPTAARPLIENAINKSFMRDRPIESRALADVAPGYRVQPGTTELAAHLGRWLNYSPVKIDNLMGGYAAGLGRLGNDVIDAAVHTGQGRPLVPNEMPDPRDVPGVRGLFSQFPRHAEPVDKMYEMSDLVREAEYTKSHLQKTMQIDDLAHWMQAKAVTLGAGDGVDAMLQQMKALREQRDMILRDKSISAPQRARQLDAISRAMLAISRAASPLSDLIQREK